MDYTLFGTHGLGTGDMVTFNNENEMIDRGITEHNDRKSTGFQPNCAQCLETSDMANGFCQGFQECYQDCGSPCTGGDDCGLPQACYDEHCSTDLCEKETCRLPTCTAGPCTDTSCPEGPHSIDTTCYDLNCFGGRDPGAFSFVHSVPPTCPPGQCQGFAPGLSTNVHDPHSQNAPFSEFQAQSGLLGSSMLSLQEQGHHDMLNAPRERKRRRVESYDSSQPDYGTPMMNQLSRDFQSDLTSHLLQSHLGSHLDYPCADNTHNDLWLNQTLLQMGISSDVTDHLVHSHLGSQILTPCSNNDHNDLWLNHTLQQLGQTSLNYQPGYISGMLQSLEISMGPPCRAIQHSGTSSAASPPALHTPSTQTISDISIFSDDDLIHKDSALQDSNTTTPENHSPVKSINNVNELAKRGYDLTCRWITGVRTSAIDEAPTCGKTFNTPKELDTHIKTVHVSALSKSFHCHWLTCPSLLSHDFHHRGKLLRHIRGAHSHYHEHVCPHSITAEDGTVSECGKTFCTKEQLKNHLTKHTGERQYVCSHCGHRSATKTQHKTHERIHSGEKPYVCPVDGCNHRSGDSSNLSKHVRNRHPEYSGRGKGATAKRKSSLLKAENGMADVAATP